MDDPKIKAYVKLYFKKALGETTPGQVHARVAKFLAGRQGDNELHTQLEMRLCGLQNMDVIRLNTPCMMNAGVQEKPQTAACFVGNLQDNLVSIFDFDRDAGLIYASGSGIGGNYGNLREVNALLSKGGKSSGPFAFMGKSGSTIKAVKSGGETRRAAHMGMMYDDHPDVYDPDPANVSFISYKAREDYAGDLDGMNLSVAVSDAFMEAVDAQADWSLYGVVDKQIKKTFPATAMFDDIAKAAWKCGCPGVWFIDRANRDNGLIKCGRIESTNPCGEQGLLSYQNCALGHINVGKLTRREESTGVAHGGVVFDWNAFREVIEIMVEALDNMIDLSGYPTDNYRDMAFKTRPIGLGIMGLADLFIKLGLPYDSSGAIHFAGTLANFLTRTALVKSSRLAAERGAFQVYDKCEEDMLRMVERFFDMDDAEQAAEFRFIKKNKLRNSNVTTIAPTGTTSISAGCSQGMEPIFAICYDKNIADSKGEIWTFVDPNFEGLFSGEKWYKKAIREIIENHGSCQGCPSVPLEAQNLFKTAHDIHWQERIAMQAALQEGITNAISSTINLPSETPWETIRDIYHAAWASGLKGVTVYRDGAKANQPVSFGSAKKAPAEVIKTGERPKKLPGHTHKVKTGYGSFYLTVNTDGAGRVVECFAMGGKNGSRSQADIEAVTRLISVGLQAQTNEERFGRMVSTLDGIVDLSMPITWDKIDEEDAKPVQLKSLYDAISKVLRRYLPEGEGQKVISVTDVDCCPECGEKLQHSEGCMVCIPCAFSKCG